MQALTTRGGMASRAARALRWLGGMSILFSCLNASAGLLVHWQMGEADPGATPGGIPTGSQDSSGNGLHLSANGVSSTSNHYTSFVPPSTGSTLAIGMTTGGLYRALVTDRIDDFAVDLWAAASTTGGNRAVLYNGDTATRGWGIYQVDDDWQILYGGVVMTNFVAPVALLQYQHLQFSRINGIGSFYVDGQLVGQLTETPNALLSTDATLVGVRQGGTAEYFDGNLDDIRISLVPEPTSTALVCLGMLGLAAVRRSKPLA